MEYIEYRSINKELLDSVKPGDLIRINDINKSLTVISVSENYFVMGRKMLDKWEYLVCEKRQWKGVRKKLMVCGKFHVGTDGWVFGSPVWERFDCEYYDFDNLEASQAYIDSFELPEEDENRSYISIQNSVPISKLYIGSDVEGEREHWHHINLKKKELDLPDVEKVVLFAKYNSDLKVFFKFVGFVNKDGYIEYQSGTWKKISETKSRFYWRELPEDPVVE